jgi:2-methylisocitrate lyase-like PEP mutase family enzyme
MSEQNGVQRERAERFRQWHREPPMLVLPNAWDAASARVMALAGCRALATTSSGVAATLGYPDGQRISREALVEVVGRITRVVDCPVTVDIEAGYGASLAEIERTVTEVIGAGAVGVNFEDSRPDRDGALVEIAEQVPLIEALRALAGSLGVPFVINARVDVFLRGSAPLEERIAEAVRRGRAYLEVGADCVYPIGALDGATIGLLTAAIPGPVNILAGPPSPTLPELARLSVSRVTFGSRLMAAALGRLRAATQELLERGEYTALSEGALASKDLSSLYTQSS